MLGDLFHTCPLQKMLRESALGLTQMMTPCTQSESFSHSVVSDSLGPHGLSTEFSSILGKNTGVGSHSFLQGIFLTQGLNQVLLHYRQITLPLSEPQGKPTKDPL